jgi:hypothetical protein
MTAMGRKQPIKLEPMRLRPAKNSTNHRPIDMPIQLGRLESASREEIKHQITL